MLVSFTDKVKKEVEIKFPFVAGDKVQFVNVNGYPQTGTVDRSYVSGIEEGFPGKPYAVVQVCGTDFKFETFVPLTEGMLSKEDGDKLVAKDARFGKWNLRKLTK